ncbi:MAG: hypothetical protein KIG37_07780 [Oscillospiraceae bacterium]|nr:hypothetical protein [Oscillospiraceae bacterium]
MWTEYENGKAYNNQLNLDETVKVNENFYIGKQWEGVQANGLPTPQINVIKRVVGFITATITTDNIKMNATALSNTPNTDELDDPVRIINDEFQALTEMNDVPALTREFARNAAVDGDGCMYTYWDAEVDAGNGIKGAIKTEIINNTRVFFGNPADDDVQSQPFILIAKRLPCRTVRRSARDNGVKNYKDIQPDSELANDIDSVKSTDNMTTVITTLWRNDEDGEIWAYESTSTSDVRPPYSLGIRLYPITWLSWDFVHDSYHGQAMITGLIPNQIFINKALAMAMISIMRTSFPKYVYDKTRVAKWDNRVGGAIPVAGSIDTVAKAIDPPSISPQVSQFIQLAVDLTEQSLGATSVALGDTRPDNTSAILALQKAASTPSEQTKQNLYKAIESLYRIYYEFIGAYYGERMVDMATPENLKEAYRFAAQADPTMGEIPSTISSKFDFGYFRANPMLLKLDVGASSYYSEIASMQTLDGLLMQGKISIIQYLERIPDDYIPRRRALIEELRTDLSQQQQPMIPPSAADEGSTDAMPLEEPEPEVQGGRGYGKLQREINRTGTTEGLI